MTEPAVTAQRPRLRSLLPSGLKRLLATVGGLVLFMLGNTLYLLATRAADWASWTWFTGGETSLPGLFQSMVLTHTGVGLVLAVVLTTFVALHLPKIWARRHRGSLISGVGAVLAGVVLVVTGLFILTAAASEANRWAWWAHVVCAALGPAGYVVHRVVSYARPERARWKKFAVGLAAVTGLLLAGHLALGTDPTLTPEATSAIAAGLRQGPGGRDRDVASFAPDGFVPRGFVPPASPFFPSAATTGSGGSPPTRIWTRDDADPAAVAAEVAASGFASETLIGAATCIRCHADVTEQWAASAHRFSSFNNPFYEATVESIRRSEAAPNRWVAEHQRRYSLPASSSGSVKSNFCGACHDPALLFTGQMSAGIDRTTPAAQAGLTCLACHRIDRIHDRTGNGNYNLGDEQEDPYVFAGASPGSLRAFLHDAVIKSKPAVHKRQLLKPFFKEAEYCLTCHKVSITPPINEYRWIRGFDEYDGWHDSGVSLNASRTFYLPAGRRVCQDCHMPPEPAPLGDLAADDGMVRSHRFLAANTALPFLRGDRETVDRIEAFLRDEKLRVDIFGLRRPSSGEHVMDLDRNAPVLVAGETVRIDVVVRNQGVGHAFPGGTNDSNEGWLEFSLLDEDGTLLAQSGHLDDDGHLDPMAHVFKAVFLDRAGEAIHDRNGARIYTTAALNVIGPGTADVAHYRFRVPDGMRGRTLTLRARLLWRKFDRPYTEFAFFANREGFKRFDDVPDLPVTEIASSEVRLTVGGAGTATATRTGTRTGTDDGMADGARWVEYNDYGIALLLEGNTREARTAFERVASLPGGAFEGHLNLARASLRDGNLEAAYDHLDQVERLEPGEPRAAWVWAAVLQEDGRYDDAVEAYRLVLGAFPGDRAAWRNLGRTFFLDQQYEQALQAFERVLAIDPEDRVSHYHQMLSYRALGREDEATRSETAYGRYRIDEAAQAVTGAFRERNPGVNLMALPIHTHELTLRP